MPQSQGIFIDHGASRQFWLGRLSAGGAAEYAFYEDPTGTVVRAAQFGRTQRLGDPINTGPNSSWSQLTWQGGEGQDVWRDEEMYKSGDADVFTTTGKMRLWPGLKSQMKIEHLGSGSRGVVLCEGTTGASSNARLTPLYVAISDQGPWDADNLTSQYVMWKIDPAYAEGDKRRITKVDDRTKPYRWMLSVQSDDYSDGLLYFATRHSLFILNERTGQVISDTGAPYSTNLQYYWDTVASFNEAMYYAHGTTLYKRKPKPPYGLLGTHTKVKQFHQAKLLRGMTVWNNRLYFGLIYPGGRSAVMVSDGATTTKAFDFPHEFHIGKMVTCAGSLYILGTATSDIHGISAGGGVIQQLYRYDGRSLKKLWQEGRFADGGSHWLSDLTVWDDLVVWGQNATPYHGDDRAKVMFYDPVNDAIYGGPGLDRKASCVGSGNGTGLWITGVQPWNHTLAVWFKDDTHYSKTDRRPVMLATVRQETKVTHDFTEPMNGSVSQFRNPTTPRTQFIKSSVYAGPDDVHTEDKIWLQVRARVKVTGYDANIKVYAITGETNEILLDTITYNGNTGWRDVTIPMVDGTDYIKTRKIQYMIVLENDGNVNSTHQAWIDGLSVQWALSPRPVRQWQIRVPTADWQTPLDQSFQSGLVTQDQQAEKLQDLYFEGQPIYFWPPSADASTPSTGTGIQVRITEFQHHSSAISVGNADIDEAGLELGSVTLTLTENVV